MYTFDNFVFGHQLSKDKNLNNDLCEFDFEFSTKINGKEWELDFPYHGGQVRGDCYSCVFGTIITDNDNNKDYVSDIRNAKEEDYINDYNIFLDNLFRFFDEFVLDSEEYGVINRLKKFVAENKPEFYSVEASS